ncbi:MAG: bifunctional metallophosphatase/5'-nucleotidase [Prevotella sp.]|nr:bifunctional metallophosphatase/5'-nucleotidase [Prevotella sp.]
MKQKILLLWLVLLSTITLAQKHDIHILAANDMHAQIEVFPQLAALIDSLRAEDPSLLVFSAGDNRTGNPINDKYRIPAYPMVALMNLTGFNGSTLGNHEFDVHSLSRLIGLSNFRYICANIFPSDSVNIKTVPYQIFDVEGLKVGIVGAIQLSPQGIPSTHPDNVKGIRFKPAEEVIPQYEWLSRECDVTILLSHLGYPKDREMAQQFPWFDLIIGGHTHTQLKGNEVENGILITQNKNKFGRVTYITLTVDSGKVVDKKAEYIDVKKYSKRSGLVDAMIAHFNDNPEFRRVVAIADTPFETREELGCMMCDAYISECHADLAVENPGGVRIDSHPAGDITVLDILEMDPFDNNAVVLELTGEELVTMMRTYCHDKYVSFPFVGGFKCEVIMDRKEPGIIKDVKLTTPDGKKFNMKKKYRVATNNYIPATSKIPEGSAHTLNIQTTDILTRFLENNKTVNYQGVRRLTVLSR